MSRPSLLIFLLLALAGEPLLAQECNTKIYANSPSEQFREDADGTVTDTRHGLLWLRCPLGMHWQNDTCHDVASSFEWADAQDEIRRLNAKGLYGHRDWRLPTLEELRTLVERRCTDPAVNAEIFPATPSTGFWSATEDANYRDGAWLIYFRHGKAYMGNKQQAWLIRPVRNAD